MAAPRHNRVRPLRRRLRAPRGAHLLRIAPPADARRLVGPARRRLHPFRLRPRHGARLPVPVVRGQRLLQRQHQRRLSVRARLRLPRGLPRPLHHAVGGHRGRRRHAGVSPGRGAPHRAAGALGQVPDPPRRPLARRARLVALERHGERLPPRGLGPGAGGDALSDPRGRGGRLPAAPARLARGRGRRAALRHQARVGDLRGSAGRPGGGRGAAHAGRQSGCRHAGPHRRARRARGPRAGARQPALHRRVVGQRRHHQARPQRSLPDRAREVGRVPLSPQVRGGPQHRAPLRRGRAGHARVGLAGAGGGADPSLLQAHAPGGDPALGERAGLARAGGPQPSGPLAERALHHVGRGVRPGALRHGHRRPPQPGLRRRRGRAPGPGRAVPRRRARRGGDRGGRPLLAAPAPADARPDLVLRPRLPQHPRPARRRRPAPRRPRRPARARGRRRRADVLLGPARPRSHRPGRLPRSAVRAGGRARPGRLHRAHRAHAQGGSPRRDGHLPVVVGRSPHALRPPHRRRPRLRQRHLRGRREGDLQDRLERARSRRQAPRDPPQRGHRRRARRGRPGEREGAPLHLPPPRHGLRRSPRARRPDQPRARPLRRRPRHPRRRERDGPRARAPSRRAPRGAHRGGSPPGGRRAHRRADHRPPRAGALEGVDRAPPSTSPPGSPPRSSSR